MNVAEQAAADARLLVDVLGHVQRATGADRLAVRRGSDCRLTRMEIAELPGVAQASLPTEVGQPAV